MTMPGNKLNASDVDCRKYYQCDHCDAVRATEEGLENHYRLKHSAEVSDE